MVGAVLAALVLLGAWRASVPGARAEERRDDRGKERDRERKERELESLQGVWKFIRYEEAGGKVDGGARRSWIINGRKWAHREGDATSPESRLEVDPEDALHHLDVWEGETHVISAIYVRAGNIVMLCGNRPADQGKGRPTRFETGTPEGGLFIIVCRIEKFDRDRDR
jgi:uncharacterized protein (TIGR03067 family)